MFSLDKFFKKEPKTELTETISVEEKTRIISEARNFPALINAIYEIGEVNDGKGVIYPTETIKARIMELQKCLRANPRVQEKVDEIIEKIPNVYGIREIAKEIADGTTLL